MKSNKNEKNTLNKDSENKKTQKEIQDEEEEIIEIEVEDRGVNTDELSPEELQYLVDNNIELKELNASINIENEVKNDKVNKNNEDYISQIQKLEKKLKDEKKKNQQLIIENDNLKEKIKELKVEINSTQELNNKIKLLEKDLIKKNNEILQLSSKKNNINNNYKITSIKPGEEVLSINFVSMGNNDIGHFSLVCKNNDLFVREEERLYEKFPQFKKYETYFEANGKRIKRFLTLDENKIADNDIINIFIIEE